MCIQFGLLLWLFTPYIYFTRIPRQITAILGKLVSSYRLLRCCGHFVSGNRHTQSKTPTRPNIHKTESVSDT